MKEKRNLQRMKERAFFYLSNVWKLFDYQGKISYLDFVCAINWITQSIGILFLEKIFILIMSSEKIGNVDWKVFMKMRINPNKTKNLRYDILDEICADIHEFSTIEGIFMKVFKGLYP